MISKSCTVAPAGFLGLGSADVRPYALAAIGEATRRLASIASVQGTRVPTVGTAVRHRGTGLLATGMPTTSQFTPIAQHDGTTLGNHSSRRPLS